MQNIRLEQEAIDELSKVGDNDLKICEIVCKWDKCINDFKFRPLSEPSTEYRKFKFMTDEEKKNFITKNGNFYEEHIKGFGDLIYREKNFNDRNRETLKSWLRLNISNHNRRKVEECLNTHSGKDIKH